MSNDVSDVVCPVCKKGKVVVQSYEVPNRPPELMIMGPGGADNYRTETRHYCNNPKCLVLFADMPEK